MYKPKLLYYVLNSIIISFTLFILFYEMDNLGNILTEIDPDINNFHPNVNFEVHSTNSFANKQDSTDQSLKIIHHNPRSIMTENRLDEYEILFKDLKNHLMYLYSQKHG